MFSSTLARVITILVALAIGAFYGAAATITQAAWMGPIPVGLLLGLVALTALVVAVRLLTADRWATLAVAFGAFAAMLLFLGQGPGGSVVVPQSSDALVNTGTVFMVAAPLIMGLVVAWPAASVPRRTPSPAS